MPSLPCVGVQCTAPALSRRIQVTDDAPINKILGHIARSGRDVLSLAQGVTHWAPPSCALAAVSKTLHEPDVSMYGPDLGLPELRAALRDKVAQRNGLEKHDVVVTPGANQAFLNLVIATLDPSDRVVLFKPYYFNHHMALQMTGLSQGIVYGPCHADTLHPDLDWLESELGGRSPPRMVVLTTPCNPTGVVLGQAELARASAACAAAGAWLVVDETYEDFLFDDDSAENGTDDEKAFENGGNTDSDTTRPLSLRPAWVFGPHVVHMYSFSKAYGLSGWRVGYLAFAANAELSEALLRAQDTGPICAAQASQRAALAALTGAGQPWVAAQVAGLAEGRRVVLSTLRAALGSDAVWGEGAIYAWARLPPRPEPDDAVVAWMIARHGVSVVPGACAGCPGHIRVSFANAPPEAIGAGAQRLGDALRELAALALDDPLP